MGSPRSSHPAGCRCRRPLVHPLRAHPLPISPWGPDSVGPWWATGWTPMQGYARHRKSSASPTATTSPIPTSPVLPLAEQLPSHRAPFMPPCSSGPQGLAQDSRPRAGWRPGAEARDTSAAPGRLALRRSCREGPPLLHSPVGPDPGPATPGSCTCSPASPRKCSRGASPLSTGLLNGGRASSPEDLGLSASQLPLWTPDSALRSTPRGMELGGGAFGT